MSPHVCTLGLLVGEQPSSPLFTSQGLPLPLLSDLCLLQGRVAKPLPSPWETPGCPQSTWIVPTRPALQNTHTDGRVRRLMVDGWLGLGIRCWLEVEGSWLGRLEFAWML